MSDKGLGVREIGASEGFPKKARLGGKGEAPREHGKGVFMCVLMTFWAFFDEKAVVWVLFDRITG
jgi:hypothetical protein